jgi:hypothetical protein
MITASLKGGIFTYQYRQGKCRLIIRGNKNTIGLLMPYLFRKIKKSAH